MFCTQHSTLLKISRLSRRAMAKYLSRPKTGLHLRQLSVENEIQRMSQIRPRQHTTQTQLRTLSFCFPVADVADAPPVVSTSTHVRRNFPLEPQHHDHCEYCCSNNLLALRHKELLKLLPALHHWSFHSMSFSSWPQWQLTT